MGGQNRGHSGLFSQECLLGTTHIARDRASIHIQKEQNIWITVKLMLKGTESWFSSLLFDVELKAHRTGLVSTDDSQKWRQHSTWIFMSRHKLLWNAKSIFALSARPQFIHQTFIEILIEESEKNVTNDSWCRLYLPKYCDLLSAN